jgi:hypothetical protein
MKGPLDTNPSGPPGYSKLIAYERPRPGVYRLSIDVPRVRIKNTVPSQEQKNCGEAVTRRKSRCVSNASSALAGLALRLPLIRG